jgi:integrase
MHLNRDHSDDIARRLAIGVDDEAGLEPFSLQGFKTYMGRLGDRFEAAGIPNWMAHRARHTWATSAHRVGMTVFDIAAEGGWRDIKMVQRYTKSRPFEQLQRLPTPPSGVLAKRAS